MKHAQSIYNRIISCEPIWKQFVILGQSYSQEGILHESFLFAQHIAASLAGNPQSQKPFRLFKCQMPELRQMGPDPKAYQRWEQIILWIQLALTQNYKLISHSNARTTFSATAPEYLLQMISLHLGFEV